MTMSYEVREYEHAGERLSLHEWALRSGHSARALYYKVRRLGSLSKALSFAPRQRATTNSAFIDSVTPYEDDVRCRHLVHHYSGGQFAGGSMTLEAVGDQFGFGRERARQVEEEAKLKFVIGLKVMDLLGNDEGERVLTRLRGKHVRVYRDALQMARRGRSWGELMVVRKVGGEQ
jgi:hypothetical protein